MKDQSMEVQSKMSSSTLQGGHSQRYKKKANSKPSPNSEFKLHKMNSQTKLDKRRSADNQQQYVAAQKMFHLHARIHINQEQTLFSLKMLGYLCNSAEDYTRFQKTWAKYGPLLDEDGFKALVGELESRGELKDHSSCFNILTQGKMVLDQNRLKTIGEELGQNFDLVMQECGKDGIIDYAQFDNILKFMNALS